MSRKRTYRRPKCGPSWIDVITANQPIPPAEADTIMIRIHDAFGRVAAGSTDDELFDRLAGCLNVGVIRCEDIGRAGVEIFQAGQRALLSASARRATTGRPGFSGPELEAMRDAIALYDEILRASTPRQMDLAVQECARRIRAGHVERAPEAVGGAS